MMIAQPLNASEALKPVFLIDDLRVYSYGAFLWPQLCSATKLGMSFKAIEPKYE